MPRPQLPVCFGFSIFRYKHSNLTQSSLFLQPLYFLELSLGQFSSFGCIKLWKAIPAAKGNATGDYITVFSIESIRKFAPVHQKKKALVELIL